MTNYALKVSLSFDDNIKCDIRILVCLRTQTRGFQNKVFRIAIDPLNNFQMLADLTG